MRLSEIIRLLETSSKNLEKAPLASSTTERTAQLRSSNTHAARERSLSISSTSSTAGPSKIATAAATSQAAPTPSSETVSSFLADRAKMERERLARQKRLRPQVQQPEETESEEDEDSPPAKRAKAEDGGSRAVPSHTPAPKQPVASSSESLLWEGEYGRPQTANRHVLPSKDTKPVWRLSEIFGQRQDQIKLIVFASYSNDINWILRVFPENVPVIFIGQPGESGNATVHNILPNWVKATLLQNGRGCMHMKCMLVFHSTGRLRIMISTANSVDYDWRDIENTAWVQDIPLRTKPIEYDPKADDFPAQFQHVLTK
ncbi:hypothetical protein M407DRAFT_23249 [Tulasnella calospora MUT 4182]|uniref:Uncharacterized protein n=1 Tax=Tulasnella calospora MUT 4182 TaxID=1051891 RepID=A0A0C3L1G4_9AGAM|nr:hypothetical protein M407DRAFT_23249 [Tulasnella calospora MUT 4182]